MVETISNLFSRRVTVDLSRTPQQALEATRHTQYVDKGVVAAMPRGRDEEELFFFNLGHDTSDDDLEKQFDLRGLKPASPYSVAKVNEDDPAFADTHPNGTHWKDAQGRWCFATFFREVGERGVGVHRRGDYDWDDSWWFAGVRK